MVLLIATVAQAQGRVEPSYSVVIRVNYSVSVVDQTSQLNAQSTVRVEYATPVTVYSNRDRSVLNLSRWPGKSSSGIYSVRVSGTDQQGCAFEYSKDLQTPMTFQANALVKPSTWRMPTKTVTAASFLEVHAYPQRRPPNFPSTCDGLTKPLAPTVISLRDLLQRVVWFNSAETALAGVWPEAWNYTSFPFGTVGFLQTWKSAPPKANGVYRLSAPSSALATAKPVTLGASLARTRQLPGLASATIKTTGRLSFTFKRAR